MKLVIPDSTGKGGTTTNSNTARKCLHDLHPREVFLETVPDYVRPRFAESVDRISIILRVISCGDKLMDLAVYKDFCDETYRYVLTDFLEMLLSPPVHKVWPTLQSLLRTTIDVASRISARRV